MEDTVVKLRLSRGLDSSSRYLRWRHHANLSKRRSNRPVIADRFDHDQFERACAWQSAGLQRVNISLDTLRQDRFRSITRGGKDINDVLEGIDTAISMGLNPVKLNMVVMSGVNDDELLDFATRTVDDGWHVRFIEFMPLVSDGAAPQLFSVSEVKKHLEALGELEPCLPSVGNGPAKYFRLPGAKGTIGFITPVSEHFCFNCNRLRLTADGKLRLCLLCEDEIDLKEPLRNGISSDGLKKLIKEAVARKPLRHHLAEGSVPKHRPFCQVGG